MNAGEHRIRFGKGEAASLGTVKLDTPIANITFHIIPFLLCLQDMKRLNVYLDNIRNCLVQGKTLVPVIIKSGHPWMLLRLEQSIACCHLTESELRQLRRRFDQQSAKRLEDLLNRAGHEI